MIRRMMADGSVPFASLNSPSPLSCLTSYLHPCPLKRENRGREASHSFIQATPINLLRLLVGPSSLTHSLSTALK